MKKGDRVRCLGPFYKGLLGVVDARRDNLWSKSEEVFVIFDRGDIGERGSWIDADRVTPVSAVDRLAEIGQFLPTEEDIGRCVVYVPYQGAVAEDGVITSMNDDYVFVRFKGDIGSKATRYKDLQWMTT